MHHLKKLALKYPVLVSLWFEGVKLGLEEPHLKKGFMQAPSPAGGGLFQSPVIPDHSSESC